MGFVKRPAAAPSSAEQRTQPRDFNGLCNALQDANPQVRRWAARDLATLHRASEALAARLPRETDVSVREALLQGLGHCADATAIAGLVQCLRSEDAALRNEAIDVMKTLPAVGEVMVPLLHDLDPDLRIFAVNILESLRHESVERWLIDVITQDTHVNVCATAVDLLGEVGTQAAVEPLKALQARFSDEPFIAFAASLALKRITGG